MRESIPASDHSLWISYSKTAFHPIDSELQLQEQRADATDMSSTRHENYLINIMFKAQIVMCHLELYNCEN